MKIDFNTADTAKYLKSIFIFQSCLPTKDTQIRLMLIFLQIIQLIFFKQNEIFRINFNHDCITALLILIYNFELDHHP